MSKLLAHIVEESGGEFLCKGPDHMLAAVGTVAAYLNAIDRYNWCLKCEEDPRLPLLIIGVTEL